MKLNDLLQWAGALFIIAGHMFNSLGAEIHKDLWNQLVFTLGTIAFMIWAFRMRNKPQMAVNIVSMTVCSVGLFRAYS